MTEKEEQDEEIEVLQSVYGEDFIFLSDSQPYKFEIKIKPSDDVYLILSFSYPLDYPKTPPRIQVHPKEGLSKSEVSKLEKKIVSYKNDFEGEAMVYNVITNCIEFINEIEDAEEEEESEINRFTSEEELGLAKKRKYGTPVTVESFKEWNEKFEKEMSKKKVKKKVVKWPGKKTGRQIFLEKDELLLKELEKNLRLDDKDNTNNPKIIDEDLFLNMDV